MGCEELGDGEIVGAGEITRGRGDSRRMAN